MVKIQISHAQFAEFCEYRQSHKWRWPAVFSCNPAGYVWVPFGYGLTLPGDRENLRERLPLLAWVADAYRETRDRCSRFFVDERGAYMKGNTSSLWLGILKERS